MTHQIDATTRTPNAALTNKEQIFCLIFVNNGGDDKQAAIEAGYSETTTNQTAAQIAKRLLGQDEISGEIARRQEQRLATVIVNRATITDAHAKIAFNEHLGTHERQRSLDSLAKMSGLFVNVSINSDLDKYQMFRDEFAARNARDKLPLTIDGKSTEINTHNGSH